ncbi:hypothetical protein F5883DRAFT_571893 [Diaporthe sp. PMI_573]|nr:hypothetical protein F5883DRAFT_571893 [Diaporthaceae sp. PMI_573]
MASYVTTNQGPGRPRKQGGPWTTGENERLQWLVNRCGNQNQVHWVEIAREHGSRDAKQCRERWDNHLKPGLNREKITPDEGAKLMAWVAQNGNRWAPLGRYMNRPENMVKNYWYQENKKAERGLTKNKRQETRRRASHGVLPGSTPMSRDNSGNSSYQPYQRSSVSPMYSPAHVDYNNYRAPGPYHQTPQQTYAPYPHYESRRPSVESIITNPPSLASDHGSPAESPRAGVELPYPPGQFALPPHWPPQPIEMPLTSPHDSADSAGHKRSDSAGSYGTTFSAAMANHSPVMLPIPTRIPERQRLPSMQTSPSFDDRWSARLPSRPEKPEQGPSSPRKGSDPRLAISNLLS